MQGIGKGEGMGKREMGGASGPWETERPTKLPIPSVAKGRPPYS